MTLALLIGFVSCKKDKKEPEHVHEPEPTPVATTGNLKIEFENMVDTNELVFGQKYLNNGDTFKVSKFNYYISNIVITKTDNSTFTEANSYHLVEHSNPASSLINLANVPVASYKSISFTLGVDSARSNSGVSGQVGDLALSNNMYWGWSSGYIMVKLEGTAPTSTATGNTFAYHIGGFGGANKTQRNFNFTFASTPANVSATSQSVIHLSVDVLEMLKTPNAISFATTNVVHMPGASAKLFADNYADMISFEHVHN